MQAVHDGKVAALMLAGGQGTRLGFDGPKGTLDIGVARPLYIYECLIRNLLEVCTACGAYVPLYIMTSDKTDRMTRAFLKEHGCFGYPEEKVRFFLQDMAPATDFEGRLLLEGRGALALSPNGNGGCFSSLRRAGLMEEAKQSGVEWINVFAVDNVLQRIADPVFVGGDAFIGRKLRGEVREKVRARGARRRAVQAGEPSRRRGILRPARSDGKRAR